VRAWVEVILRLLVWSVDGFFIERVVQGFLQSRSHAIRDLLSHGGDLYCSEDTLKTTLPDSPLNRVLMDFAVYGGQGKNWVELIDARTHPIPGFEDNLFLRHKEEEGKKQPLDELLRITNELCRMFVRKDVDASAGLSPPDLMERCRYHSHAEKGLPCYLDK
jgi:hypothetical protein